MGWDNVTNTVSVTDGAGTNVKSVVITGFLESEVDGDVNNELITAFTWNDGTDLLRITEAGANWDVWIDNEADDLGDNNLIDVDPEFVDRANGDYHLLYSSPAIDAGDGDIEVSDDMDGDLRPMGGGCDIGADEAI